MKFVGTFEQTFKSIQKVRTPLRHVPDLVICDMIGNKSLMSGQCIFDGLKQRVLGKIITFHQFYGSCRSRRFGHDWKEPSMSDYYRTTRECPVSQLDTEVLQAFRNYFHEHQLGDLEAETLRCCETISSKRNLGGLVSWLTASVDTTVHTGILLTSQWLIWARRGDKSGTVLTAANLNHISVRKYTSIFANDAGLEVIGYIEGSQGAIRGYIGMGTELATQKFCDEVRQAIAKVNPPVQRLWPKWLGG